MRATILLAGLIAALATATPSIAASCQQLKSAVTKYVRARDAALASGNGTAAYCNARKEQAVAVRVLVNYSSDWLGKCGVGEFDKHTYDVMFDQSEVGRSARLAKWVCEK